MPIGIYKRTKLHSDVQIGKHTGNKNGMWKGNYIGYDAIHYWLRVNFGKANMCMDTKCDGTSKAFQWALLAGKKHERNRNNYVMMCAKCHRRYDDTPERNRKGQKIREHLGISIGGWNKGLRKTHCKRGHDLSKNSYIMPNGYRSCRICRKESDRRRYVNSNG